MIKPIKVLRALKPKWSVPLFIAYWGAVFVMAGGITVPGPDWINWAVVVLPSALVVLALAGVLVIISIAGVMSVKTYFFGKRLRRRIREALRNSPAVDPGISHTALMRSVQGSRSLVEDVIQELVVSGELERVQKGRVRRYFVKPVRAETENASVGPTA